VNAANLKKLDHGFLILKQIKKYVPDVILAGGAIRDAYHNKEIKDYDFFISSEGCEEDIYDEEFWVELLDLNLDGILCDSIFNASDSDDASCTHRNHIDLVWEIEKHDGTVYNIIILDMNPEKFVNQYFDIGLCKAYSNGKKLRLTSDFTYDSRYHELTIVQQDMTQEEFYRMMDNHVHRLKLKYPGWKLVVPDRFQDYYDDYNRRKI